MKNPDIIIVGGGHAGIEASIITARMGFNTILITLNKTKIGLMSCNPAIGGLAKGQLVREIDALGGSMGKIIDQAGIHFKMLNTSKGPAVQSPRAQADRNLYAHFAQHEIAKEKTLSLLEEMVTNIIVEKNRIQGVVLGSGEKILAGAVILTAGTFLNGIIHMGSQKLPAGRAGDLPAKGITEALHTFGFRSGRLKTGTPPRIHKDYIDYSKTEKQHPDINPTPFSFSTETIDRKQVDCLITYTNQKTHDVLREGFDESPMFTGRIKGIGPRYCPSIEDKIDRFADKLRHQLFLEPEGYTNNEVYVNGFSTSLPGRIQERALRTVQGLEKAKIIRLGYAVEYDFFPPDQLYNTLETKSIEGLYFAGQINGTSGYEEAAAQGLMAGINAGLKLKKEEPFILRRSEAYIGVLIDDLISKAHEEPYRMFTSRAEFRLMLRHDNADLRLMDYGKSYGLIDDKTYEKYIDRKTQIEKIQSRILNKRISANAFNGFYNGKSSPIKQAYSVEILLKRPEVKLRDIFSFSGEPNGYSETAILEVEYQVKYQGYLDRQRATINKFLKTETRKIPESINYTAINALSTEAREKLQIIRPENLGQASRISGVRSADISVLMIYLEKDKQENVSRETK